MHLRAWTTHRLRGMTRRSNHEAAQTARVSIKMALCTYSSDELAEVQRILQEIIAEAQSSPDSPDVEEIIERLFDLADHGERDPQKLRASVLRKAA